MLFGIEWTARVPIDTKYLYHGSDPTREPRLGVGGCKTPHHLYSSGMCTSYETPYSYLHTRRPCRNFTLCAFVCTNILY